MKTDNELIEQFWIGQGGKPHDPADLWFYESSWDMLMPVVGKIGKLYERAFPSNEEFIKRIMEHNDPIDKEYIDVISISIYSPIKEVYEAVIEFIKWYNQNKP